MMLFVVSGAAAVGFLSSVVMLWMGLRYMPVRYALASFAGYGAFLFLMSRWLGHHRSALLDGITDIANPLDLPGGLLRGGSRTVGRATDGLFRGGRSGGGGASASFDSVGAPPPVNPGSSKGFSLDLDDADGVLPVVAVIAIIASLVACASVVWQAPQMLTELLADGAAAGAAYKGLRASSGDWTFGVIRRTWLPAAAIIVTFVLLGVAGHYFHPGADSIADFFR